MSAAPLLRPRERARFGAFEADLRAGELWRRGCKVRLAAKPFEVLAALLQNPGEVVLREELCERLWPGRTYFDFDNNLNSAVATLREALGDSANDPQLIETLPKRGYRLLVEVEWAAVEAERRPRQPALADAPEGPAAPADRPRTAVAEPRPRAPRLRPALAGALLSLLLLLLLLLMGPHGAPGRRGDSAEPEAHEALLRGRYLLAKGGAGVLRAMPELERAVALDPGLAAAHAALAQAWQWSPRGAPRVNMERARAEALWALTLDESLPEAHLRLGDVLLLYDYDWRGAEREYRRALALDPAVADVHVAMAAFHSLMGRHGEALAEIDRAVALDPIAVSVRADAGWYYFMARRYRDSIRQSRKALELEPRLAGAYQYLILAHLALGEMPQARRAALRMMDAGGADPGAIAAVRRPSPGEGLRTFWLWDLRRLERMGAKVYVSPSALALRYLLLGDRDRALDLLARSLAERSGWVLPFLRVYPPSTACARIPVSVSSSGAWRFRRARPWRRPASRARV